MEESPKIVFIVGPTSSGKSDWAYEWANQDLAQALPVGIMNSDSIQVYKELNIGSAKPDFTKYPFIPHYLFDEISAPQVWTAGQFRKKALSILESELSSRKMYIIGGSGFYIQALEKGMYETQALNPEQLKHWEKKASQQGLESLYKILSEKDPERAKEISPKDTYRIIRSLVLIDSEGKKASQIKKEFQETKLPWPYIKVGLNPPKEILLRRVKARVQKMLKEGLIEEIEAFIQKGFRNWPPLSSVGYKEAGLYLEGKITKEELLPAIVSSTMSLIKKQKTWFKRDKNIQWLEFDKPALKVYKKLFK